MVKVSRSQLRLEKILEFVNFGGFYDDQPVSGQKVICQSLDNPNLRYEIYIGYYLYNAKHTALYTKKVTPNHAEFAYIDDSVKYADLDPGRYHCKLIEYVSRKSYVVSLGDIVQLNLPQDQYALLTHGGEGCGKVIWVYWENGEPYARYCTRNCKGVFESNFSKKLEHNGTLVFVPIRNVKQVTSWYSCTFNWDAPTNTRIDIWYVTTRVIDEFDLNVPAPTKPEEQPKEEEQPAPQPQEQPEQQLPPKLTPSPVRKMSGHVIGATVEDDLVKVSVSVTSDGIGTAVAEITYSKDGVPVKTQKVPFQVAAGQNTKVLVSKMPFCGSFEMTVKLTDQNGNLIGPVWEAAVQCRKATVTPMPVEEKPAGEAEKPGVLMPVEMLPEEAGEGGGKIPGWLIALAIAAGVLAMKGGD